jgi:pimeloyl-ACP methyl ester carboxylesterase
MTVPLDRAHPDAGTVDLAVTRRAAPDPKTRLGSLLVNPGGPGASAIGFLQSSWRDLPDPVRARFDLVAFDPRGVGRSAPVKCLSTAQLDAYFALDPSPDTPAELTAVEDGDRRFAAGCSAQSGRVLPHVSTDDAARDMDVLRASLGDPGLTYLGYSYGTSIGAEYLKLFPTKVRAMVLDGAIDPALTWDQVLEGQSKGFDVALQSFLADCQRTSCAFRRAVQGDLGAAFDALAARVDRSPLTGKGARTVGPGEFTLGVGATLYDRAQGWPVLAEALRRAEGGDGQLLLALSDSYLDRGANGYSNQNEANAAVNCVDRPWPRDPAPYLALAERVRATAPRFGPDIALSGLGCAYWPVPAESTPAPVRGDGAPPVVVVGTTRDPATPYVWAQALAHELASGVLLTHEGDGHTAYRASAPACLRDPVDQYLLTAKAPAPLTC